MNSRGVQRDFIQFERAAEQALNVERFELHKLDKIGPVTSRSACRRCSLLAVSRLSLSQRIFNR